jgi:hypothetical protein
MASEVNHYRILALTDRAKQLARAIETMLCELTSSDGRLVRDRGIGSGSEPEAMIEPLVNNASPGQIAALQHT